jgi:sensor domain CHASE-containing protein
MKEWIDTKLDGVRSYYIYPRRVALVYALVIFLVLLLAWLQAGRFIEGRLANAERDQISARVNTVGTSLTLAVNQRLNLITSVRSFIEAEVHSDIDFSFSDPDESDEVNKFATGLYESVAGIRNIAIAPNGVMEYVYPYEENKTVLGYEPIQDERLYVRDEVRRAVQTGEIVLSLPYELIQGGQGLIARQAIYVEDGYWGLANLVLDMPPVLEDAGVAPVPSGLDLGLKDQSGKLFFGSEDVFLSNPVTYTVILPEGDWELAGVPNVGWGSSYRMTLRAYRIMGLITIAAISLVTYQLVNRRDRLADLVDRRTQELNLSNQTLLTVLEGINADVYVADFDTFEILFANKHIRDSFNDDLVGKICYQVFRNEDSICAHCQNDNLLVANVPPTETIVWEDRNPITGRWYKNADRAIRWHDGRYVHLQIATDLPNKKRLRENWKDC